MKKRLLFLDDLRGFFILLMVLYHMFYDIVFIFGVDVPFYTDVVMPLQPIIPLGFATIVGFGCFLSNNNVKRGAVVFGCGLIVSVATLVAMPQQAVVFGVLSMLGIGTMICGLLKKWLLKINPIIGCVGSVVLFSLSYISIYLLPVPQFIASSSAYANNLFLLIGYPAPNFYSSDYFPITPWVFTIILGFFIARLVLRSPPDFLYNSYVKPLGVFGRKSLIVYMLHQPILYGVLYLIFSL